MMSKPKSHRRTDSAKTNGTKALWLSLSLPSIIGRNSTPPFTANQAPTGAMASAIPSQTWVKSVKRLVSE